MIKYLKTILSNTLPTADSNDIGLLLDINDLSPFLKSGITDAVFHCVGNSDLESDKLNKREMGTQTVLHVFLSI
jgi:hypothetical protein